MEKSIAIKVDNVHKTFLVGDQEIPVLKGISFDIEEGDFLIIVGPSGCGKSTLLNTILGLEEPNVGKIIFYGTDLYDKTTEDDRADIRKQLAGLVYQQSNWIKSLNVVENVYFPLTLLGRGEEECHNSAMEALKKVNMEKWAYYAPTELSSGQQQRVSLSRALIHNPELIVADEPTGNLDYESGQKVMQLLYDLCKTGRRTIIMVTHDLEYIKYANKIVQMLDGVVTGIYNDSNKKEIFKTLGRKRGVDEPEKTVDGIKKNEENQTETKEEEDPSKDQDEEYFQKLKSFDSKVNVENDKQNKRIDSSVKNEKNSL